MEDENRNKGKKPKPGSKEYKKGIARYGRWIMSTLSNKRKKPQPGSAAYKKIVEGHGRYLRGLNELPDGSSRISKAQAMQVANNYLGSRLLKNSNSNYSKINDARPVWWFNINPKRFMQDLYLILAKDKGGFILVKIPKEKYKNPEHSFRIRKDKNLVDLEISTEPGLYYLRDIKSGGTGFNFKPYLVKEF